jgi:signal transduction histidine kinase
MKVTSISKRLLTRVLSVYFILTVSVTGIQIVAEYFNTKSHINSELLTLQKTISSSLTRAVWELNTQQTIDIAEGLIAIPMIKGITVTDEAHNIITQLGEIKSAIPQISRSNALTRNLSKKSESQSINSLSEGLFGHSFPLIFEFSGRSTKVGTVELLSNNDVIFSRIKVGIYFLIGNAMLKTAFLVFLFLLAFNKLLTEPLTEFTEQIKKLDIDDPEESKLHVLNFEKNELSILEDAYNGLIDELIDFKSKLSLSQAELSLVNKRLDEQNLMLEQEVAGKTSSLNHSVLKVAAQQKELLKQQHQLKTENDSRLNTETTLISANKSLTHLTLELNKTQERLLAADKMATLGALSAEIAHEVNTPIGISITSTSYLSDILTTLASDIKEQKLSKRAIEGFINNAEQSITLLLNNLNRASELITGFKQVAVDQSNDKIRLINIARYLDEIIQSLQPKLKKTHQNIKIHCDENIEIYSHPGAIAQIITNLIINSLTHAFAGVPQAEISINIRINEQRLHLDYQDNGIGITTEQMTKLFDPFYTTKGDSGGTGLGAYIINNLVVDTLHGNIRVDSILNEGLSYHIDFPDMRET